MDIANNPCNAFAFHQQFNPFTGETSSFPRHYLLYASNGAFDLEVADTYWYLPPDRAAWIAVNVPITVTVRASLTCSSVLFKPDFIQPPVETCRVFSVSPLIREMIMHATRWGPERDPEDGEADRFFKTLADVATEAATATPTTFWLPVARSSELSKAMAYTATHLDEDVRFSDLARYVGLSERTLARRFADEAKMTWRQYQRRARLLQAMAHIAQGELSITEISLAVGFTSVSAFINAFQEFTGETPGQYQKRFERR